MGTTVIGLTLAGLGGRTSLNDPGVLQFLYLVLLPAVMVAMTGIAEFWVESLPSQVTMNFPFAVLSIRTAFIRTAQRIYW